MLKYLFFPLMAFLFHSCSYKKEVDIVILPENALELDPAEGVFYHNGKSFSGRTFKKYTNDSIARTIAYKNGKKEGQMVIFFKSGDTSHIAHYSKGVLNGRIASWWNNGNKRSEGNYLNGKVHGEQKQWYESGAKYKVLHYSKGVENGLQQAWRENGKIIDNYENRNGRIYGLKKSNLCFEIDDGEIQF
jgi:antitoxin component YwqK of YwqJK toxin-antitoxin module